MLEQDRETWKEVQGAQAGLEGERSFTKGHTWQTFARVLNVFPIITLLSTRQIVLTPQGKGASILMTGSQNIC